MTTFLSDADLTRLQQRYPEVARPGHCPTCHNTGGYRWQGIDFVCDCAGQKRLLLHYLHAGIGLNYQRLTWDDVRVSDALLGPVTDYLEHAQAYIDKGIGLLLWGPLGTGKTLIANLVLKELIKRDYDCYVTTFAAAVENFTATWGNKDEKEVFAQRFMDSRILGLDDLGKEAVSRNRLPQTTFDYILRKRVENARPTILTTNMSPMELQLGYGSAVLSLLVESSIEVSVTGADFRPLSHDRKIAEVQAGETRPIA